MKAKYIVPYLEHNLKVKQRPFSGVAELKSLDLFRNQCSIFDKVLIEQIPIEDIIPILRPLSDLTKEIEVNGKKFVPLLEICKFLNLDFISYEIKSNSMDLVFNDKLKTKGRFWFSNFKGSGFYCSKMNKLIYKDIIGAIEKLFEWHFDVFGLIEKGLAIDFNTLNNEKNTIL